MLSRYLRFFNQEYYLNIIKYNFKMISSINNETYWSPGDIIDVNKIQAGGNYAIAVLNREILIDPNIVKSFWDKASIRVCIDGGANRWLTFLKQHCQTDKQHIKSPDYLTGDFDSITSETVDYFTNNISQHIMLPNQNETDFTKSLILIGKKAEEKNIKFIIVIHENSGRLDHIMANINTLFKASNFLENIRVYLLSSNSISWLLKSGKHSINIPSQLVKQNGWCSFIPIGNPCTVTTTGLKWNMTNEIAEFSGIVSTSNTYASEIIKLESNGFLLWCMGVYNLQDD